MVHHHADVFQGRLALLTEGLVQAPTEQRRVVLGAGHAVEDGVVGVVLLRDEDDVFDLGRGAAGDRRDQRRRHRGAVGRAVDEPVVLQHPRGHRGKGVIGRGVDDAEHAAHAEERALRHLAAGVGAVAEAAETDAGEMQAVRRDRHAVRIPGRGDVAEHLQGGGVEHADRVDAELGDVETASVRGERHARGADAAQTGGERRRLDAAAVADDALDRVDPLDEVVVPVRDEQGRSVLHQEVRGAAAHGLAAIGRSAHEEAGLHAADNFRRGRRRDVDAPDRERFRDVGFTETGDLAALEFHAFLGLFAGESEGRTGQAAAIEPRIFGRADRAVLEESDVGDLQIGRAHV